MIVGKLKSQLHT